ncbi:ABC transporter ATP-binding protein [Bacillaceae bacterium IKA-2]|nr:ABC transporter ATP-binding protein [Bacillaceae bacterium IKA-2]
MMKFVKIVIVKKGGENGQVIKLVNCQKEFSEGTIFKDITVEIAEGEIVSLVGPSGTGKSTLLRCIAGLENLTSGEIFVEGNNIVNVSPSQRPIVMMFQQTLLFPHLTVIENVTYGLKMRKVGKRERIKGGQEFLAKVEMTGFENRYPYELSGGQQQRVALARALILKPKLLLLDEPFSSLDPELRSTLREWVHGLLKQEGMTAMFVTHDKEEAMLIGDRVAVLENGTLQQIGTPDEVYHFPKNKEVAAFFSEGFVLDSGLFVPVTKLTVSDVVENDTKFSWKGRITKRFMKYGQSFDKISLDEVVREIIIPTNQDINEEDEVIVTINETDVWQLK